MNTQSDVVPESTLTCPNCGASKLEQMPTDARHWFYECSGCKTPFNPK